MDDRGLVYALDSYRNTVGAEPGTGTVQVFDADGQFLSEWGEYGSEPGQLAGPFGIGLDPDGTLLIAEFDSNRVQRYTPEGEQLDWWGRSGYKDGEFVWPMDVAVDDEGHVFVTDYGNHRVQVFDRGGGSWPSGARTELIRASSSRHSAERSAPMAPSTSPKRWEDACKRSAFSIFPSPRRHRRPDDRGSTEPHVVLAGKFPASTTGCYRENSQPLPFIS